MSETLLIAGTASHVGKSTIVAGMCRLLHSRGISVAPFKAQNMSNNAQVVATPDGSWGEIGISQYVQCQAAGIVPITDVNPVLLKPRGNGESQLLIDGTARGHIAAGNYYEEWWDEARQAAVAAYERLANEYDVIIAEGAGSIAEINLHDRDLANIETAHFANASILLVVDIERGGAFASTYGTLALLPKPIRKRVIGIVINKFRGDDQLLQPGITELEDLTGVPVLGVLPFDDPGLPAEDSVSLAERTRHVERCDDTPTEEAVTIAVPHLPRIANFTDMDPLDRTPGVRVRYVPLDGTLEESDAVIIPGTKNTVDDLMAIQQAGMDEALRDFDGPIIGICGGYQILGTSITNADREGSTDISTVEGIGLLPVTTTFNKEKQLKRVRIPVSGTGPITAASGEATGYEIHMGTTVVPPEMEQPLGESSCATDTVLGTYLHGMFENEAIRHAFLEQVYEYAGKEQPARREDRPSSFDAAATLIDTHLVLDELLSTV